MSPGTVTVHVVVNDANGKDVQVRVTDVFELGRLIPEKVAVVAAEAGALANEALRLPGRTAPIHRDRRAS